MLLSLTIATHLYSAVERPVWREPSTSWSWSICSSLLCSGVSSSEMCQWGHQEWLTTDIPVSASQTKSEMQYGRSEITANVLCSFLHLSISSPATIVSSHVFICIYNWLRAILDKCRQQLGECVNHWGLAEIVGALFGATICDRLLKSLLIHCGRLFFEIVCFSMFTSSIRTCYPGLCCFSKKKSNLQNELIMCVSDWNRLKQKWIIAKQAVWLSTWDAPITVLLLLSRCLVSVGQVLTN